VNQEAHLSLSSFTLFEGPDIAAFFVCAGIGFFAGSFAPSGSGASLYVTVLVAYHLFLAWLVFLSSTSFSYGDGAQKKAAISLPIGHTLLTHAACLAVILGSVATAAHKLSLPATAQHGAADPNPQGYIIYQVAKAICGAMAGLAIFERRWLFSAEPTMQPATPAEAPPSPVLQAATADDMREWQQHLAQQKPGSRRPGSSLKAEYEQWLLARQQARQSGAIPDPKR
jgi:hypothetical protein